VCATHFTLTSSDQDGLRMTIAACNHGVFGEKGQQHDFKALACSSVGGLCAAVQRHDTCAWTPNTVYMLSLLCKICDLIVAMSSLLRNR